MKGLMAKVTPVADIVPVASVEEAGTLLDLNTGFHFIVSPGGQWLYGTVSLRGKRPNVPVVVFENCDAFLQRKFVEAGAAFVAPHVEILKDYRTPNYGELQVVWPQIGSVVYSEATKVKYTITGRLGEGGYAHVFRCTDFFGQSFVMKILKTFKPKHETEAEWQKEARFLLSLRHPNIIQIYDMFEHLGLYYLIVEECHGSLRQLMEQTGALPVNDVIAIAGQMLSGLHHIHSHSVIHRDLQNDNILYVRSESGGTSRYQIKITDFGISKFNGQAGDSGLPAYTNIGRPYDVAPELIVAGYTTHQSDIYQVGLVLYYLYRGTPALGPEDGPSSQAIATGLARHRAESLARMLRRRADWRFRDSMEVWTELSRVQQDHQRLPPPAGPAAAAPASGGTAAFPGDVAVAVAPVGRPQRRRRRDGRLPRFVRSVEWRSAAAEGRERQVWRQRHRHRGPVGGAATEAEQEREAKKARPE
ncbi:serinethreonine protein kinase, putative [Acanthamoeba castellanii str. Neff]|uniref:Serinethreonine protein kinase, putative n=1 Tax=Acanthamoeba castellanii (strain ATCC 30010 / Neff) TaxID=1257118 RepID=L8GYD8_ACACF|nr:serinethreonine protein kinase, putative [Acanthamoeba castellanii str. Neff]ELR18010.1 serinethreonine protein kinase, putative [Acanthamoeba castellanii str. Neff]